jgi:hypothetical protein
MVVVAIGRTTVPRIVDPAASPIHAERAIGKGRERLESGTQELRKGEKTDGFSEIY